MKVLLLGILCSMLAVHAAFGQIKIGDNPQNIDPASVLELESSSRVLVITRVNTSQMTAIAPQRGGIIYNTDTECIHYYNGLQWINLCDAVDFTITNDPIINNRITVEVSPSAGGYNLEIAKNSILGDMIVDGGIGPADIQDNSIGQEKLAAESVGSSEIRQNAVSSDEIRDGSIAPVDIANAQPSQVLTTDENGLVQWEDSNNLRGAVADAITITGEGTITNPLALAQSIQLNITNNTTSIADHIIDDNDTDDANELQELRIAGNRLSLTNGNEITLPAGAVNTDNQTLSLNGNNLEISGGNSIPLPDASAANELQDIDFNPITNILTITNPSTPNDEEDLSSLIQNFQNSPTVTFAGTGTVADPYVLTSTGGGTANGVITNVALQGTDLVFEGTAPGFVGSVPLAGLGGGVGTDDQNALEVPYDNTASGLAAINTQAAIDELAGGGFVDTDDQNAAEVAYDNTTSGLAAINTQAAIDELCGRLSWTPMTKMRPK